MLPDIFRLPSAGLPADIELDADAFEPDPPLTDEEWSELEDRESADRVRCEVAAYMSEFDSIIGSLKSA